MWTHASQGSSRIFLALVLASVLVSSPAVARAQGEESYEAKRERATLLLESGKFLEALPMFEKLSAEKPNDAEVIFGLGFSLFVKAQGEKDADVRKQGRAHARTVLVRAKELGYKRALLDAMLESLKPDGEATESFSKIEEADRAMHEGEAAYIGGDLDQALAHYQRALQLDPQLYLAALFAGDMYNKNGQPERADEWFAKAIKIDPNRETAYRYWGIGLMRRNKTIEARDKFIDAYISSPSDKLAVNGLVEWADHSGITLAHPVVTIPTGVSPMENGKITITVDPKASSSWMIYGITRAAWTVNANAKFYAAHPDEKTYRHSLREEAEALRRVAEAASGDLKSGKTKSLDSSLANLVKINEAGLLEAYILLARADEGIAKDYYGYLKTDREKLRRYVLEIVMSGK
jgi:tetratricopeptide (TPR) repeat protein